MKYAMVMVTAIALGPGAASAHSLKELEDSLIQREKYVQFVERVAPPFTLIDAAGGAVGLSDFRGKVVVLNFIYTHCPDVCPLHSALIAALQEDINRTPMRDAVRFISITTDPRRDTPEAMREYGEGQGLDPVNWSFLTSGADDLEATRILAAEYGLKFTPGDEGYQMHGVVTHVIDGYGVLRARFHGLKLDPLNIVLFINALTNDIH